MDIPDRVRSPSRRDSAFSSSLSSTKSVPARETIADRNLSSRSSSASSRDLQRTHSSPQRIRPRRMRATSATQVPRVNVADAIALHERSRAILQSGASSLLSSSPGDYDYRIEMTRAMTTPDMMPSYHRPPPIRSSTNFSLPNQAISDAELAMIDEKSGPVDEQRCHPPAETIHWTSDETRRREYAEIDRASKGFKGLLRRIFPRLASRSCRSKFYDAKDASECGSVRRYRLDMPDEDQQA